MLQHLHPVVQMVIVAAGLVGACIYIYAAWRAAYSLRISIENIRIFRNIRKMERKQRAYGLGLKRTHKLFQKKFGLTIFKGKLVKYETRFKGYYGETATAVVLTIILVGLYFPIVYFVFHQIAPMYSEISIESISQWKGRQIVKYIVSPLFIIMIIALPAWLGWSMQSVRITGLEGEIEL